MADKTDVKRGPHDLITEEHIKKALEADKGTEAHMTSWSIKDFTKPGDNYATFVTSVSVSVTEKGEAKTVSYVVKLNPCREASDYNLGFPKMFAKEARFYSELLPELNSALESVGQRPLRIPKYLYFSLEKEKEIIFLEDLRPQGFRMSGFGFTGVDLDHAMLMVNELARFHSAAWLLQQRYPEVDLGEKYDFLQTELFSLTEPIGKYLAEMSTAGNTATIDMLEHCGGYDKIVEWIEKRKTSTFKIMNEMLERTPPFDTICHGDVHSNNVIFRYDESGKPVEVMLLDLQVNRIASVATDLNFLLYMSLAGDVRAPNLDTLLESYFDCFIEVVVARGYKMPFSLQELHQEFHKKHPFVLAFVMMSSPVMILEQTEMPKAEEMLKPSPSEVGEEDKKKYLKDFDTNHKMRRKFLSVFDEMDKVGIFDE